MIGWNENKGRMKWYTFLEVIVAMAIFLIMTAAVSKSFVSGFMAYRTTRSIQKDLETAQFTVNTLAKSLRTSSVITTPGVLGGGAYRGVGFYDYSQKRCFQYVFTTATVDGATVYPLKVWFADLPTGTADPYLWCRVQLASASSTTEVTTGYVTDGRFFLVLSDKGSTPKKFGRVVIKMTVRDSAAGTSQAEVQTSVSLRDYNYVGM